MRLIKDNDGRQHWYSRSDIEFFNSLFPESKPEICKHEGCHRSQIDLSVLCARHHFEMIKKKPCPWETPVTLKGPSLYTVIARTVAGLGIVGAFFLLVCFVLSFFFAPHATREILAGFFVFAIGVGAFFLGAYLEEKARTPLHAAFYAAILGLGFGSVILSLIMVAKGFNDVLTKLLE